MSSHAGTRTRVGTRRRLAGDDLTIVNAELLERELPKLTDLREMRYRHSSGRSRPCARSSHASASFGERIAHSLRGPPKTEFGDKGVTAIAKGLVKCASLKLLRSAGSLPIPHCSEGLDCVLTFLAPYTRIAPTTPALEALA